MVDIGDLAPDFALAGTGDRTYTLAEYRGQVVVLVFYPGDASPICTEQLRSYNTGFVTVEIEGVVTLAMSPQNVESHEKFAANHGFSFPLLFDEHQRVGNAYAILGPLGFYRRSVFVIDADGVVRFASRSTAGLTYPDSTRIANAITEARKPFAGVPG